MHRTTAVPRSDKVRAHVDVNTAVRRPCGGSGRSTGQWGAKDLVAPNTNRNSASRPEVCYHLWTSPRAGAAREGLSNR